MEDRKLLKQMEELKYEKLIKKSQTQFKDWLKQKGFDVGQLSDKEISEIIKNLQINNSTYQ